MAAFIYTVSSYTFFKMSPFSERTPLFNFSISIFKLSIIFTTFEFGSLMTANVIASWPFILLKLVGFL